MLHGDLCCNANLSLITELYGGREKNLDESYSTSRLDGESVEYTDAGDYGPRSAQLRGRRVSLTGIIMIRCLFVSNTKSDWNHIHNVYVTQTDHVIRFLTTFLLKMPKF